MEMVLGMTVAEEPKWQRNLADKSASGFAASRHVANPVVYKLVRVDTDGRLIPATDDELMEVEGLLENEKNKELSLSHAVQSEDPCADKEKLSEKSTLEGDEGLMQSDIAEVASERLNAPLEYIEEMLQKVNEEEKHHLKCESPIHSSSCMDVDMETSDQRERFLNSCERSQSGISLQENLPIPSQTSKSRADNQSLQSVENANLEKKATDSQASNSALQSSKPDFSRLKEEVNLDKLTVKELHDTFRATFGRRTLIKDKQWLKRRIVMGLTNSCEVPMTSFIIKDKKIVKKDEDESLVTIVAEDPATGVVIDCGKELSDINENQTGDPRVEVRQIYTSMEYDQKDNSHDAGALKRIRKPTKRYIEELSDTETRDRGKRFISPSKGSAQVSASCHPRKSTTEQSGQVDHSSDSKFRPSVTSNAIVLRCRSLGSSGVQVPLASRMRRSRPRKSIVALTRFQSSGMGTTTKWDKNACESNNFQLNKASDDKMLDAGGSFDKAAQNKILDDDDDDDCKSLPEGKILDVTLAPCKDWLMDNEIADDVSPATHDLENFRHQGSKYMDSSANELVEMTNSMRKGGMRRKHHRAWTLTEVMKLVDGVAKFGAGRWSEIKKLSFASVVYRTPVDLKDKWRNLLKASFAALPSEVGVAPRKSVSTPLPEPILLKVRDLAKLNDQLPKKLKSGSELSVDAGRTDVNVDKSGYL